MPAITAFVDLSHLSPEEVAGGIAANARADRLGGIVSRAIVHLNSASDAHAPPGWRVVSGVSATQACQWAFDIATHANTHLLVLAAGADAGCGTVGALLDGLDQDPLFGVAIPRLSDGETSRILVTGSFGGPLASIPRRVLASLTDYRVLTESLAPCMLFRREVAANLGSLGDPQRDLWDALAELAIRVRRAGFRTVLCNKVDVGLSSTPTSWGCSPLGILSLQARYPELTQLEGRASGIDAQNGELILAAIAEAPDTLLLDARSLETKANGTSRAILGLCDALHRARPDGGVGIWVSAGAAAAYALDRRYPQWTLHDVRPESAYAAAVRLSQPWYMSDVESLERVAGATVFWILDTIAWDIAYCAPDGLDAVWQHVASEADGLLFISDFSRRRFETRFGCRPGIDSRTCRLSLDPRDYARPVSWSRSSAPYWFVVGNSFDHKHIPATIDLLSRSFPRKPLLVLGDRHQPRTPNVTRLESGKVEEETMSAAFAHADAIIFPSFYEGFGLPIIEGLSYGRTVVARASSLVDELAAEYRGPGRLLTFSTERELIGLLNDLERGGSPEERPLGEGRTGAVWTWDSAAREILRTTQALVLAAPSRQMLRRTGLSRGLTHNKCD
jgi:glycosyltransferase involved in cell wall biosynthesis